MKSITQEDPMGCGIACVAFALNRSYLRTKRLFEHPHHSVSRGYYCREIVKILNEMGLSYTFSKSSFKNKKLLNQNGTIVFVARCERYPHGHYLIKTRRGWMNSWINFPCVAPARSGFEKKLPGKVAWIIYNRN